MKEHEALREEIPPMKFEELPEMLRVEEAAELLRISRSRAYAEVGLYQSTDGASGLPSIRIGRTLRVPKRALLRWIDAQLSEAESLDVAG
jgi:hypothetical protein